HAVIVLAGVNDLYQGYSPDWVKRHLSAIYERALQENIRVIACTILPYNGSGPAVTARMREVNDWIRSTSAQQGLGFCDLFRLLEDPKQPGNLISTADGLHPDPEGYRRMGEALADVLEVWGWPETAAPRGIPFKQAWWCRGRHLQTIWGSVLRPTPRVALRRERWETPDGDFLDLDTLSGNPSAPILIVLPGLEGSSRSKQILGLLQEAKRRGWRGLAVNFRSCSGQPNRLRRSYHAGETSDLAWVIQRVVEQNPDSPVFCVGLSLGGNVLLKYLGEQGEGAPEPVRAAVAISTPFDLEASVRSLERGFSRFYMRRLVASLRRKALAKLKIYPDLADRRRLKSARTLGEFDDAVTAPVHGFRDAVEYWTACSSKSFLAKIRRPALLINARDDPFLPEASLPVTAVSENSFLTAEFPRTGGHVGFLAGVWPGMPVPWAQIRAIRFLEEHLKESDKIGRR
ncbi:MAG: alpha/beta fold hydrolase, partial [Candidatus Nitrosotenuis sp.]